MEASYLFLFCRPYDANLLSTTQSSCPGYAVSPLRNRCRVIPNQLKKNFCEPPQPLRKSKKFFFHLTNLFPLRRSNLIPRFISVIGLSCERADEGTRPTQIMQLQTAVLDGRTAMSDPREPVTTFRRYPTAAPPVSPTCRRWRVPCRAIPPSSTQTATRTMPGPGPPFWRSHR